MRLAEYTQALTFKPIEMRVKKEDDEDEEEKNRNLK